MASTDLDLLSVRLALAIVEHRGLRRAALSIGMSEAAASQRLRSLEDTLTVSLFSRTTRGLRPTDAGLHFFRQARDGLRIFDSACWHASRASKGRTGKVTVGLYTSLSAGRLREALRAFQSEHPDVDLEFVEGARWRLIEGLTLGTIDLIFLLGPQQADLGEHLRLWSEQIFVVSDVSSRHASRSQAQAQDLVDEPVVVSTRGAGPAASALLARMIGVEPDNQRAHHISREMILSLVSMGFGNSILLESDVGNLPDNVVARPLEGEPSDVLIDLTAYRDPSNDNPSLRRFWSLLKSRYADRA
ncbi:LysR family transcriptional regulator [Brevundimonas aurifodinae]|uniref:LysR family transcriptional regulator n=1 Tax=Brevundimonas aurifodinae TaxID=1508312 RepID=A0ABV1NNC2_9CAUL